MTADLINLLFGGAPAKKPAKKTTKSAAKSPKKTEKKSPKKVQKNQKKENNKKTTGSMKFEEGKRYMGVVEFYNAVRGFGFIKAVDGDYPDVFVHKTAIMSSGLKNLDNGQSVSFEVQTSSDELCKKGNCAHSIKVEKSQKGGSYNGQNSEQELFHRLLDMDYNQVKAYFEHAGLNKEDYGMTGGSQKMSKLAMINSLLSE